MEGKPVEGKNKALGPSHHARFDVSPVGGGRVSKQRGGALISRCSAGLDSLTRAAEVRLSGNAVFGSRAEEKRWQDRRILIKRIRFVVVWSSRKWRGDAAIESTSAALLALH